MSEPQATVKSDMDDAAWRQIARWLEDSDLASLEISGSGWQVRMLRHTGYQVQPVPFSNPLSVQCVTPSPDPDQTAQVVAPHVGIFLDRHPLRSMPMAQTGSRVKPGDIVCLLKVGQVLAPVVSAVDGVVTQVWASSGEVVGYGQKLFEIKGE